jgi:Xaa-Pro aminopeptidase
LNEQVKNLRRLKEKCDAIVLVNYERCDPNFFYFTHSEASFTFFLYDFKKPVLLTNELEERKLRKETWIKNVEVASSLKEIKENLKNFLKSYEKVGVVEDALLARTFKFFSRWTKLVDISQEIAELRAIKDKQEIKLIKKACRFAVELLQDVENFVRVGMKEQEIRTLIKRQIVENGLDFSFQPIVNSGPNSAIPHFINTNRGIRKNDIVLLDVLPIYQKYFSDVTRTIFVGKPIGKAKEIHEIIEDILNEIEDVAKVGMKAREIDNWIRKKLGKYAKYFVHASGHGIGLEAHEKPFISKTSEDVLKENMVFAIEPGVYLKRFGIRIEDVFLLRKARVVNLTRMST